MDIQGLKMWFIFWAHRKQIRSIKKSDIVFLILIQSSATFYIMSLSHKITDFSWIYYRVSHKSRLIGEKTKSVQSVYYCVVYIFKKYTSIHPALYEPHMETYWNTCTTCSSRWRIPELWSYTLQISGGSRNKSWVE